MKSDWAIAFQNFSRRTGANFLFSDSPRWPEHLFTDLEGKPDDFFPDFEVRRRRRRRQEEGVLLEDLAGTRIFEVSSENYSKLCLRVTPTFSFERRAMSMKKYRVNVTWRRWD